MSGNYAVIVAAGRGSRFGGPLPKQYLPLGGGTVLRHAAAAFAIHPRIAGVQVVNEPGKARRFGKTIRARVAFVLGKPDR